MTYSPRRPRFLTDVDEVLASFQSRMLADYLQLTGKRRSAKDCDEWDIFSIMEPDEAAAIREIINQPGWCENLSPLPGAQHAIKKIRETCNVIALTSHFKTSKTWVYERDNWLKTHFGFASNEIVHTSAKYLVKGDFFLDDNPEHVIAWQAAHPDGEAMLWHVENTRSMGMDDVRVHSWDEVIAKVKSVSR